MRIHLLSLAGIVLIASCSAEPVEPLLPPDVPSSASGSLASASADGLSPITLRSPEGKTVTVRVEHARTRGQQELGLMFRTSLAPQTGMLFTFNTEQGMSFWMKNTLIPLDILYFNKKGELVSHTTMTPCEKDPCPVYPSGGSAIYVLEVPAGSAQEWGVGEGWTLEQ